MSAELPHSCPTGAYPDLNALLGLARPGGFGGTIALAVSRCAARSDLERRRSRAVGRPSSTSHRGRSRAAAVARGWR
jgi:hypothetical protein